jgi:hypothetical protein
MKGHVSVGAVVLAAALGFSTTMAGTGAVAPGTMLVVNSHDDGPGSFRHAILAANGDAAITRIQFVGVSNIRLLKSVEFSGAQALTIDGNGGALDGSKAGGAAFLSTGGGNLSVNHLKVRNSRAEGIVVQVPPTATGTLHVSLVGVEIVNNSGHGVLVNDQEDSSTPEDAEPNANGSPASVDVSVLNSRFIANGYSVSDRDGLRVNEGGDGDLIITVKDSVSEKNGADGIEADERGAGDVRVQMHGSRLTENGPLDPADLDDGFDIDEWNDGSIVGSITSSVASRNREEGFDFNENHNGDLRVDMHVVEASWNGEEGIDLEEDDDFGNSGDLVTVMSNIVIVGNGNGADGALKIREKETGSLDVTLTNILSADNFGSGIFVRESSGGSSVVRITGARTEGNRLGLIDGVLAGGHGIELLESGAGDLTATIADANSAANEGFGIFVDETGAGAGTASLGGVTYVGAVNLLGERGGTATFVILP